VSPRDSLLEEPGPVRVVIVDDHAMFTQSLARLLDLEEDIEVIGVGADGTQARELVRVHRPRVLLLDVEMPGESGIAVAADIRKRWPDTMIVIVTASSDDATLLAAVEAGCLGLVTKDRAAVEVVDAIRVAAVGEALMTPAQLARLLPRLRRTFQCVGDDLTEREREVLGFLAAGKGTRDIADTLFLSVNTVRNYVASILAKLGAHSKLEAVVVAVREGVIRRPS
jgi:DNA-binding NarL/FixJ family response regulator